MSTAKNQGEVVSQRLLLWLVVMLSQLKHNINYNLYIKKKECVVAAPTDSTSLTLGQTSRLLIESSKKKKIEF